MRDSMLRQIATPLTVDNGSSSIQHVVPPGAPIGVFFKLCCRRPPPPDLAKNQKDRGPDLSDDGRSAGANLLQPLSKQPGSGGLEQRKLPASLDALGRSSSGDLKRQ